MKGGLIIWETETECCVTKVTGLFGKRGNQTMIIKRTREKEVVEIR